jgi:hypothetical protein
MSLVFELEIFILELGPVYALPARTVVIRKVPALAHELGDDAMEGAAGVAETLLAGAKGAEILGRFRDDVRAQFERNAAQVLTPNFHIKVN